MDKLNLDLQTEQKALDRLEDKLALEVRQILSRLEKDLIKEVADHNPGVYLRDAARDRHLTGLIASGAYLIKIAYKEIHDRTNTQLILAIKSTGEKTQQLLALHLNTRSMRVSNEYAKNLAGKMLVDGAVQRDWWASQSEILRQRFTRAMREGLAFGENLPDLIGRVTDVLKVPTNQAETLARTSLQTVAQQSRMDQFKKNSDVIAYVVLSATMDSRVTEECFDRDGKKYTLEGEPVGHSMPFNNGPPYHFNCRTQLMPEVKPLN